MHWQKISSEIVGRFPGGNIRKIRILGEFPPITLSLSDKKLVFLKSISRLGEESIKETYFLSEFEMRHVILKWRVIEWSLKQQNES